MACLGKELGLDLSGGLLVATSDEVSLHVERINTLLDDDLV